MQEPEFASKIKHEYRNINAMIEETSNILEGVTRIQGQGLELQYSRWTMYLCLVKKLDPKGVCYGVRWAKYRISTSSGRKSWYDGWLPGKVPPSTVRLMSPEDKHKFKELNTFAAEISDIRHRLTSKKKSILATFQNIGRTEKPRLQGARQRFKALQEGVQDSEFKEDQEGLQCIEFEEEAEYDCNFEML